MRGAFRAATVLLAAGLAGCATLGGGPSGGRLSPSELADSADAITGVEPVDQVHFGILAVEAATGRVLLSRNADNKFIPASNMKVPVTVAALDHFGPDHRLRTELYGVGARDASGRLDGDLVLPGTGDPTLSDRYWPSGRAALEALADSLLASGVNEVTGALVVDASRWDSATVASTWMVGNLSGSYSANGGAFAINEGELAITARGASRPGAPAEVTWTPEGEAGFVLSYLRTVSPEGDDDIDTFWLPESRRFELRGTVPAGETERETIAIRDPVRQASAALHRVLEERGVRIAGGWRVAWDRGEPLPGGCETGSVPECAGAVRLASLASPPMIEIVEGILEPSQNWMTEQLVRILGGATSDRASWGSGLDEVERFLVEQVGVDERDLSLRDGSGLSAYNLVTPRAMVAMFEYARAQPWGAAYRDALAEPGEGGSTLSSRLEELEGRLWGKTGTISNVNSLSGYLQRRDGALVIFSVLSNGSGLGSSTVRSTIDDVVRLLDGS